MDTSKAVMNAYIELANKAVNLAIEDALGVGSPRPKNSERVQARKFLKRNCDVFGEFLGLDEEQIFNAKEKLRKNIWYKKNKKKEKRTRLKRASRKVMCVETGEVFNSASQVYKEIKIGNVYNVCMGKYKTAGGFHWKFVDE